MARALGGLGSLRPGTALGIAAVLAALAVTATALHGITVPTAPPPGRDSPAALARADANGVLDSDGDGVSDARENYIYGTDPRNPATAGSGIPDGWLVKYGFDPLDPGVAQRPAARPPADALPKGYHQVWPEAYTPTLMDIYSFGKPADWDLATRGPHDSGLDPRRWDANGDGVPDGYLLRFGLDPRAKDLAGQRLAGSTGLTVRQAYEHQTDPRKLDTDDDGIPDAEEVAGPANPLVPGSQFPPTDPNRWDSNGAGVCDGYLRAHGLDPSAPAAAYGDPDRDGATTREEFLWSHQRFGAAACATGKGLNPTRMFTEGLPIPDGWLIRYGLDPLDPLTPNRVTERASTQTGPPILEPSLLPADVALTVLDEYRYGRPHDWSEAKDGPWWGGTRPDLSDTDGDGLGDAWEMRGYVVNVTTDPLQPLRRLNVTRSDPTVADTDGDGLLDGVEADPRLNKGFITDARRRDTDQDGIPDDVETANGYGLDPTRADSTALVRPDGTVRDGDGLRDGKRLELLLERSKLYAANPPYGGTSILNRERAVVEVFNEVLPQIRARCVAPSLPPLGIGGLSELVGPRGDLDGDGILNILDSDIDCDTLGNGLELDPRSQAGTSDHPATDPLNADTDGDGLFDDWELKYGSVLAPMDPTRSDSDGDGVNDGDEDPDQDGIDWYVYLDSPPRRVAQRFNYTNLLEQGADTHPTNPDTDGDGLGDGWKYFWSREYPALGEAQRGLYQPSALALLNSASLIRLGTVDGPSPTDPHTSLVSGKYQRSVLSDSAGVPLQGAMLSTESPVGGAHRVLVEPARWVVRVEDSVNFTLAHAKALKTNPFMANDPRSSDGDLMPDWWEALFGKPLPGMRSGDVNFGKCLPESPLPDGPDPTRPDGSGPLADPDQDGLSNYEEYDHDARLPTEPWSGGNPLCKDSDLGGISDDAEGPLRIGDPLDDTPDSSVDSDGDGVNDFNEIVASPPTKPDHPDSDGDGLLDGPNQGPYVLDDSPNGKRARLWLDLGIAYSRTGFGASTAYTFLGEQSRGTSPTVLDAAGAGVPQGWLATYDLSTNNNYGGSCRPYYELFRPSWWKEILHGPWWGGRAPSVASLTPCPANPTSDPDRDKDGLADLDANLEPFEDAMPANYHNRFGTVQPSRYGWPGSPLSPADPRDSTLLNATARRLAAQAYFNHVQGARAPIPDPELEPPERQPPNLTIGSGFQTQGTLAPKDLPKGVTRILSGSVKLPGSGNPAVGITVQARMNDPNNGPLVGAAFTDAEGNFNLPVNVSVRQKAGPVPPGSVLRGQAAEVGETLIVHWNTTASQVLPGGPPSVRILYVVTYSNATLRQGVRPLDGLNIIAEPRITFLQPTSNGATAGQELAVRVRVHDSGDSPLAGRVVRLSLGDGEVLARTTNAQGIAEFILSVPRDLAGPTPLVVRAGTGQDGLGPVDNADQPFILFIRNNPTLTLDFPATADAGGTLPVSGHVSVKGQDAANATVTVRVAGASGEVATPTDAKGRFQVWVPLHANIAAGKYSVVAAVAQGPVNLAGQLNSFVDLRGLSTWKEIGLEPIKVGQTAEVTGRLVAIDGTGIAGAPVRVTLGDLHADATTDAKGRVKVFLQGVLPARPTLQTLSFGGSLVQAPARVEQYRAVSGPTTLFLPGSILPRGADAHVALRLLDDNRRPVAEAPVQVTWGNEPNRTVLTDADGRAVFVRPGREADPLGPVLVEARFAGAPDGTRGPSKAQSIWLVRAVADLLLPSGNHTAGQPVGTATLRDAGTLRPIAKANITLQMQTDGGPVVPLNRTTDGFGRFQVLATPEATVPPHVVHVTGRFDAPLHYPTTTNRSEVRIRSATSLDVQFPATIVLGRETLVPVRATDARHLVVPGGPLRLWVGERLLATGSLHDGFARLRVGVPLNDTAGETTLRVSFDGSPTHAPSEAVGSVRLVAPSLLSIETQPGPPGGTTRILVLATAGGSPLPFAHVNLEVQGEAGGLAAVTDKDGRAEFSLAQGNGTRLVSATLQSSPVLSPASASQLTAPHLPLTVLQRSYVWAAWAAGAAAVVLVAAALVARRLRRHPLTSAFHRTRLALAADGPLEKQVLLAYRALEDAAIAHEILDAPAMTPRGLQEAIAPTLPRPLHANLDLLISLFELARYGRSRIRVLERDAALRALDNLTRNLNRLKPVWRPGGAA